MIAAGPSAMRMSATADEGDVGHALRRVAQDRQIVGGFLVLAIIPGVADPDGMSLAALDRGRHDPAASAISTRSLIAPGSTPSWADFSRLGKTSR